MFFLRAPDELERGTNLPFTVVGSTPDFQKTRLVATCSLLLAPEASGVTAVSVHNCYNFHNLPRGV